MSNEHPAMPPQSSLFQIISGMWAAQAVATAANLGIADKLAHGPKSAAEIAATVGADTDALHRLMRAVAATGVFATEPGGRFSLTPVGECLRSDVPGSMRSAMIAEMARGHWLPWGNLEKAVRTGRPVAEEALGMNVWEYYKVNAQEGNHFAEAMSGFSAMAMQAVMAAYSFSGARTVVDVGGSHGAFLATVLARETSASGILFDRPEVVEGAGATLDAAGVTSRVERKGGNFFESVPSGGDTYLLKHILHDWNDADCVKILGNVARAMAPTGRVVIVELLLADGGPPNPAPLMDLNMLVMLGGKERTAEEYSALFAKAGLKLASVTPTHSPFAVIEARRA